MRKSEAGQTTARFLYTTQISTPSHGRAFDKIPRCAPSQYKHNMQHQVLVTIFRIGIPSYCHMIKTKIEHEVHRKEISVVTDFGTEKKGEKLHIMLNKAHAL